jgi:glycosyltransferase involved in cell wall biosynthesis
LNDPDPSSPLVTVLVPARNEAAFIGSCLDSITRQSHRNLEILVVDGASKDDTRAVVNQRASSDPRIRLLDNPMQVIPFALNIGLREARGTWLVRVDAHSSVPETYVERIVAYLTAMEWGGVGGRKDGVGLTPAGRAIAAAMSSPFAVGNSTYHYGTKMQVVDHLPFGGYSTAMLRALGGWDERILTNEDFEMDFRIRESGRRLLFDPEIRIEWICRQSVKDLLHQYVRYGKGKSRVAALHPRSVAIRHTLPPLLLLWLAAAVALLPFRPLLAAIAIAPYLAVVIAGTISVGRRLRMNEIVYLPLIFPAMHLGWGYGFLRGAAWVVRERVARADRQLQTR